MFEGIHTWTHECSGKSVIEKNMILNLKPQKVIVKMTCEPKARRTRRFKHALGPIECILHNAHVSPFTDAIVIGSGCVVRKSCWCSLQKDKLCPSSMPVHKPRHQFFQTRAQVKSMH